MDEFVYVLVAAFIVLILLFAFGTPLAEWASGYNQTAPGNYEMITTFSLGRVGYSETLQTKTVNFGDFVLGKTQSEELKKMPTLSVATSLIGQDSKKFNINIDRNVLSGLKDVKISFDMGDTNLYGDLIIKWNGKVFFQKRANLNHYDIKINPQYVEDSNILEVSAGSPGLLFWASTTYTLENFVVNAEYGPEKFFSFHLYPNEIESWNMGYLKFYTTKGQQGELLIKLNGHEIYREQNPEHLVSVELNFSRVINVVKIGDNVLSFKSDEELSIDNARFELELSTNKIVKERKFEVTEANYNRIKSRGGKIYFTVDSIYKEGVLTIKMNGNQINVQTVRTGENQVDFTDKDVSLGQNVISFSGTGSWDISNVKIVALK